MNGGMSCKSSCTVSRAFESVVNMTSVETKRCLCTTLAADIICAPEFKMSPSVQNFYTSVMATAVCAPFKSLFRPYFRLITVNQFSCLWWLQGISLVEPLTVRNDYCSYVLYKRFYFMQSSISDATSQLPTTYWFYIYGALCPSLSFSVSLSPTLSAEQHTDTAHQSTP